MKKVLAMIAIAAFAFALPSCKGKSDADIKTEVDAKLATNPDFAQLSSDVKDGAVTISGTVKDDATKTAVDPAVKEVKGVKSVVNNASIPPPPPPPTINPDDLLNTAVADAIKDHPGVKAEVKDGVVTLTGEIKKADLATLMQKVNSIHPRKVEQKLTVK
ncbi:BON domain-containing protein [Niabella pedocola]|uniref:BON domain-containing protein n=1 Tax=Niabella pedocola TaxID=1752077 RepID=A0ABS8PM29_9BACT|nr:BON domain-containing protein [Niabella pedocola]MCD2421804.1 BON domain-containing protein [Niabella pedocola]